MISKIICIKWKIELRWIKEFSYHQLYLQTTIDTSPHTIVKCDEMRM